MRVGDDYYLVTSTFQYFPGIRILHSRDLVQWTGIGHVLTNADDLDLRHYFDGCGVWAPDISYHGGYFYVFYCLVQLKQDRSVNVRGNYMVRSRSILGPYSKPVQLTAEGNDPSHFVDDDGSHHMAYAAGVPRGRGVKIVRLTDDCSSTVGEARWLEFPPEKRAPEGPHLFKRDGYYYLTLAAGGGVYDGHHQVIARSRALHGPYEPDPRGAVLAERSRDASYYHHGHAKFFTDPQGEWWMVYLLRRRLGGFSPLGRETALDRVDWNDDGWPVVNHGEGPSDRPAAPGLLKLRADFSGNSLGPAWQFLRAPEPDLLSLEARPGALRLSGSSQPLESLNHRGAALLRERSHHFSAVCTLEFAPSADGEAGLTCYYDTACHLALAIHCEAGRRTVTLRERRRGVSTTLQQRPLDGRDPVELRVEVHGLTRRFSFRSGGAAWSEFPVVSDCSFLSDEGTPHWGFTGTMVGVYAVRGPSGEPLRADVLAFETSTLPAHAPAGW